MKRLLLTSIFLTFSQIILGSVHNYDTVTMKNDHVVIGEIKVMENGVLTIKTDYSDSDFKIEWAKVKGIKTNTEFIISLSSNDRFVGKLLTDPHNSEYVILFPSEGSKQFAMKTDIVYLKGLKSGFWDRISANVDGGLSITKASSTTQISLSGDINYLYSDLGASVYGSWIKNIVQDTIKTDRSNVGTNWRIFLKNNMLIVGAADFLNSDEQNLELRTTVRFGLGRFLIRNDKVFLVTSAGLASNHESYKTGNLEPVQSIEGFIDTEFNAFDIKDFRFVGKLEYYPNLSTKGRNRINTSIDLKWDLPKDFYIGGNLTLNYDSKPVEGASQLDYVIQNKIGWSF